MKNMLQRKEIIHMLDRLKCEIHFRNATIQSGTTTAIELKQPNPLAVNYDDFMFVKHLGTKMFTADEKVIASDEALINYYGCLNWNNEANEHKVSKSKLIEVYHVVFLDGSYTIRRILFLEDLSYFSEYGTTLRGKDILTNSRDPYYVNYEEVFKNRISVKEIQKLALDNIPKGEEISLAMDNLLHLSNTISYLGSFNEYEDYEEEIRRHIRKK